VFFQFFFFCCCFTCAEGAIPPPRLIGAWRVRVVFMRSLADAEQLAGLIISFSCDLSGSRVFFLFSTPFLSGRRSLSPFSAPSAICKSAVKRF